METTPEGGAQREIAAGFRAPSFHGPLDVDAEIARIPPGATTKGLYLNALRRVAQQHGVAVSDKRYVGLLDYPNREYSELVAHVAAGARPDVHPREALRLLGHHAFPELRESMVGRAVFGVLGDNLPALFALVGRAWRMSTSHVRAELLESGDRHAVVEVVDCHAYLDSYVVGIFEGVILATGRTPRVLLHQLSPTRGRFHCRW